MKKLKLQMNDLRVDSFETTAVRDEKGTVFGEQCTCQTVCTCPGCATCEESCNGTCNQGFSCQTCLTNTNYTCCDATCGCYDQW